MDPADRIKIARLPGRRRRVRRPRPTAWLWPRWTTWFWSRSRTASPRSPT